MKRKTLLVLTLALLLSAILATSAFAVSATATPSTITIDGQTVSFDAYLINGSNYLKLRDLAYSLTGTSTQFNVGWDGYSILLTSDTAYAPKGGEMSKKGTGISNATLSSSAILKDGVKIPMVAYNIDGSNYFKLRDLAQIFDFSVEWNASSDSIAIDSKKSYVMPSGTSMAVNSYPLLLVGMTKAQIDAKLGAPTNVTTVSEYHSGIWLGYDTSEKSGSPTDSSRCNYVGGFLSNIVSGCPSSLTIDQIRSLFGSADILHSSTNNTYYLDINYGGSMLVIYCDSRGTVTPESYINFDPNKAYSKPEFDYSWAIREWTYSDAVKSKSSVTGDTVEIGVKEASATKLVLDGLICNYYGYSWVQASIEDVTLTSSDGKTYTATGVTDGWLNTINITIILEKNKMIFHGEVTHLDNMARFSFGGDYTLK